jgi:hypothetical protein
MPKNASSKVKSREERQNILKAIDEMLAPRTAIYDSPDPE